MRYAICNETFEGWDHADVCRVVADAGYQGLEVAPFTLAPRLADFTSERRHTYRKQAEEHGLAVVGLHWLLARTEGMQLTSPTPSVRQRTAQMASGSVARPATSTRLPPACAVPVDESGSVTVTVGGWVCTTPGLLAS